MIGDSTDSERAWPDGEGLFDALGKGYVSLVAGLLTVRYPARRIRIVNKGLGGNTLRDLRNRWQTVAATMPSHRASPQFLAPSILATSPWTTSTHDLKPAL